jgi:energy-coupling factor transport system ATP-binding protein
VIELRDVRFRYDDGPEVLAGVDLRVDEGELVVVAGYTGTGKSTLLGLFSGLVPAFTGGTLSGDVRFDGRSLVGTPARDRAHLVGHVVQDPAAGFVTDTVEEELAYGMEQLGLDGSRMRRRVEETLDLLGISDLRRRALRTLSGGEQQRVAIGAVLTMHPKVLMLDEPTSALDPTAAEDVLATLARLVQDVGITVLLAEHRLERVVPFADRLCLLTGDGSLRVGDPAELLATSPVAPPIVELGRLAGWDPVPLSVRAARRQAGSLRDRLVAVPERADLPGEVLLAGEDLSVAYGRRPAVRGTGIRLAAGEVTAVMGRNGSGKTSLLWALQGGRERSGGRVSVMGRDPARLPPAQRRSAVGLVPQTAADLLYLETVAEECAAADRDAAAAPGTCGDLLAGLVPRLPRQAHPRDLSEGQRLALVLAVVLTARPRVVLLDEPTRGLDYSAKAALVATLRDLAGSGHAVCLATHDVELAALVADHVLVLAEGEVVSSGPSRRVLAESPAFAPQVSKILDGDWLTVPEVRAALSRPATATRARHE